MSEASPSPPVTRLEIFGWAMFDFANSSYTTIIVTFAFSVYFREVVVGGERGDWLWGVGLAASNLLVLLAAPVVGAVADGSGRKKPILAATWLACVVGTAALYFATPGSPLLPLGLFVFSNVAFATGEPLVAAFLPEISTPTNVGRISGLGWGLGYFGGLACLVAVMPLTAGGIEAGNLERLRWIGPVTAAFFLVAGLPTFLLLKERAPRQPGRPLGAWVREGFSRLAVTARSLGRLRQLSRFLAVYFTYACGLYTVIAFAAIYARSSLGFDGNELSLLFLALQLAAAAGALAGGPIQDRFGSKRALLGILGLWIAVCAGAALTTSRVTFWWIALGAGLGIGSLLASSRGVVALFAPPAKSGEIFGFWGMASRAAYALGPFLFGTISAEAGSQRIAVAVTGLFFVAGWVGLTRIDEEAGLREAREWGEPAPPIPDSSRPHPPGGGTRPPAGP